jgi:hypothetical protein
MHHIRIRIKERKKKGTCLASRVPFLFLDFHRERMLILL